MEMTNRQRQVTTVKRELLYTAYELIHEEGYPALTIRRLCERNGVSTEAFYHHYSSKEDLVVQGFASYDEGLSELLNSYYEKDPIKAIRHIVLGLNQYIFDNRAQSAKELYTPQLSTRDNYTTKKSRSYYQAVLGFVRQAANEGLITPLAQAVGPGCGSISMDSEKITDFLLRTGHGTILDWRLHNYAYDLVEQSAKDLGFILNQLTAGSLQDWSKGLVALVKAFELLAPWANKGRDTQGDHKSAYISRPFA